MNIYVSNLSFDLKSEDLKQFFTPFGEVSSSNVIMDKVTSRSRGFGFVEMADDEAAKKAIAELDGTTVSDRVIKVNEAKPRSNDGGSFRSGGSGRSSGSDRSGGDGGYNKASSYNQNRY